MLINRELSKESFQLRHIENFNRIETKILIDTPMHTIQGFIVDIACENFLNIFNHDDFKIIFKNNNFWLFIDFDGDNGTELAVCKLCNFST